MTVAMVGKGVCECGHPFLVFQPEKREIAEKLRIDLGDKVDIFISDKPHSFCSKCDQEITLPISEELDIDRHHIGQLLDKYDSQE